MSLTHDPCCTAHGASLDCETYRRTHFVEVGNCCDAWAARHAPTRPAEVVVAVDHLVSAIEQATRNRDFGVVNGLVMLLAIRDPQRAQAVLDTIKLGLELGGAR